MALLIGHTQVVSGGDTSEVHSAPKNALGTRAYDRNGNEYMYVEGVASVAAGDFCTISGARKLVRLAADAVGPVGVAMAALVASTYGWVQVGGVVEVANIATATTGDAALYASGTAGRASVSLVEGDLIVGARAEGNAASNVGKAVLCNPFVTNDAGSAAG